MSDADDLRALIAQLQARVDALEQERFNEAAALRLVDNERHIHEGRRGQADLG
jgi:hypothetical protein